MNCKLWLQIVLFIFVALTSTNKAQASGWSWSLGHNNPPGATVGINFMHLWSNWAFEFGIGAVQLEGEKTTTGNASAPDEENRNRLVVGGDVDLKYLFGSSWFRPYLQGGAGAAVGLTSGDETSAGAGVGGSYFGGGVFLMGNPFYLYLSINTGTFYQVGLGFDF